MATPVQAQRIPGQNGVPYSDTGSATISGRLVLATGVTMSASVKIILSKPEAPLVTLYTNKTGEFNFTNLLEGNYVVQAIGDEKIYEPVTRRIHLNPGEQAFVIITLAEKNAPTVKEKRGEVVSAKVADSAIPLAARKAYDLGIKSVKKNAAPEAIAYFKEAIALYENYLAARNDLGVQYLKLKRFDEAAEQFDAILEQDPKFFSARLNLGIVRVEQKRYAEAIDHLSQAIAANSANAAAHLFLGIAALDIDDLPVAEKELVRALLLGGNEFAIAHYYFAHIYLKTGRREEAARELKLYLAVTPVGETATHAKEMLDKLNAN
ncbi:MAG: tetratricopeptide repeat protein [Acidobacteriota bacterium]